LKRPTKIPYIINDSTKTGAAGDIKAFAFDLHPYDTEGAVRRFDIQTNLLNALHFEVFALRGLGGLGGGFIFNCIAWNGFGKEGGLLMSLSYQIPR
jgi:hypothetical protein